MAEETGHDICAVCADMGTTNTRVWLVRGSETVARASRPVGVRDTARTGSASQIRSALREAIAEVTNQGSPSCVPTSVVAAGMIGSSLGLTEVPHIAPPAGLAELAALSRWFQTGVTDLPVLLVPGIRFGPANAKLGQISDTDVMRGEETLCVGLVASGLVKPPAVVLNLGSHWKAIRLNHEGQVESSVTSLSGELIHAAQTQTILAASVAHERPNTISETWMEAGMKEQRKSGLARALFCVRLCELANEGTPEERLAFLIGAFIASDLDALTSCGVLPPGGQAVIAGAAALAEAWRGALTRAARNATVLTAEEAENALLAGLRCILACVSRRERSTS